MIYNEKKRRFMRMQLARAFGGAAADANTLSLALNNVTIMDVLNWRELPDSPPMGDLAHAEPLFVLYERNTDGKRSIGITYWNQERQCFPAMHLSDGVKISAVAWAPIPVVPSRSESEGGL